MKTLILFASISALLAVSNACGFWGQLYCDYCWDGQYTTGTDTYIAKAQVTVNCTVIKDNTTPIYFWGTDTASSSDGSFEAPVSGCSLGGNAEAVYMSMFKNSDIRQGLLSNYDLTTCKISVTGSSACPNMGLKDGVPQTTGAIGNGVASNVFFAQYLATQYADVYIASSATAKDRGNSVPLTPATKGQGAPKGCPASPPPPPGLKGDPHFTGADGSHFDFTGLPGEHYCLVSDSHLHINAFYGGRYAQWGDNPNKPLTWIRSVGMLWGGHTVQLDARQGARWQYDGGYMARIQVDGADVALRSEGDSALLAGGTVEIVWAAAGMSSADDLVDVYTVRLGQVALIRLTLRPEVALLRTPEDGVVHFDIEFPKVDSSAQVHGVLGQTFRPDHRNRLAKQKLVHSSLLNVEVVPGDNAEGFLDGQVADYRTSALLAPDCQVARYSAKVARDSGLGSGVQVTSGGAVSTFPGGRRMMKKVYVA